MVETLLTTVKTDMLAEITSALPLAGAVFAALAGISVGIRIFKKVSGARG